MLFSNRNNWSDITRSLCEWKLTLEGHDRGWERGCELVTTSFSQRGQGRIVSYMYMCALTQFFLPHFLRGYFISIVYFQSFYVCIYPRTDHRNPHLNHIGYTFWTFSTIPYYLSFFFFPPFLSYIQAKRKSFAEQIKSLELI